MKDRKIAKFVALFDELENAARVVAGEYDQDTAKKESLISQISTAYKTNRDMLDDQSGTFLNKVWKEIKTNLYDYPLSRNEYITGIVRYFNNIAPYLIYTTDNEMVNRSTDKEPLPGCYLAAWKLLRNHAKNEDVDGLTVAEKYILSCHSLLEYLYGCLEGRCLDFDMNLDKIQIELGIFIRKERAYEELIECGYIDKLMKVEGLDGTETLPEPAPPASPSPIPPDKPVFEERLLIQFHGAFDGYLWESVDFETFNNWFRVKPLGKPVFKPGMMTWFCYAVGKIERKRITKYCPNFGKWVTQLIGNINYSTQKKKAQDTYDRSKAGFIDHKLFGID
jgi:hypothetical protein